jgi:hypothetical protein
MVRQPVTFNRCCELRNLLSGLLLRQICNLFGVHLAIAYVQGDAYSQNGHYTGDSNGTGTSLFGDKFLLAETRVGSAGQKGWKTLNNQREIPWVWSVIEFDQNGYPDYGRIQNYSPTIPTTNYQIFPTYSVYVDGKRLLKIPAGTPAAFAGLPPGLSLPQNIIQ